SWKALHEVLRDRSRNVLFNHLGLREDSMGMIVRPDCADLPYFLRAYFAFKMGLPFGYTKCTRGGGGEGPKCHAWWNIPNLGPPRGGAARGKTIAPPRGLRGVLPPAGAPARSHSNEQTCGAEAAGTRGGIRRVFALGRRRWRSFRNRANSAERRQHRLLSRAAERGDAAPRHRLRRSLRAHPGAGEARSAVGGRGGRLPRRRRAAGRDGRAQAVLARQFPVRAGSRARRTRVQALPPDRARQEWRLAAADQRRDRERSPVWRFLARSGAAFDRRLLRSHG